LAEVACAAKPHARLVIENVENSFRWLERNDRNEPMTYTAQWNDDMHHVLDFLVTGDGTMTGYDEPNKDPYADFEKALADGFVHDPGEGDTSDGHTRGGPASQLPPDSFITYVQNHDQIGNRADSKRLPQRTDPSRLDFAHFVKLLAPQIPLCFMGDEGNLTSGFPFFVDLPDEAAKLKRDDRYKQMTEIFNQNVKDGDLPEPNDPATFASAKLRTRPSPTRGRLAPDRHALSRCQEHARRQCPDHQLGFRGRDAYHGAQSDRSAHGHSLRHLSAAGVDGRVLPARWFTAPWCVVCGGLVAGAGS
jgi:1,4-alpha-glucan branching enzyme